MSGMQIPPYCTVAVASGKHDSPAPKERARSLSAVCADEEERKGNPVPARSLRLVHNKQETRIGTKTKTQEDRDITYALLCSVLCIVEQVLFDEILILSVEENPHVYDKRRTSYKDEKMKENTWLSIDPIFSSKRMRNEVMSEQKVERCYMPYTSQTSGFNIPNYVSERPSFTTIQNNRLFVQFSCGYVTMFCNNNNLQQYVLDIGSSGIFIPKIKHLHKKKNVIRGSKINFYNSASSMCYGKLIEILSTGHWNFKCVKVLTAYDQKRQSAFLLSGYRSLPSKETLRGHSDSSFRGEGYIQCCIGVRLCDMYSNQELAEIHFMYGKADGNAALARRLYQERYPQRQCPDRKTFVRLHYRLCEYGKFNSPGLGRGRPRSTTPEVQEEILEAVNMTPSISTRRVALQVNVSHTTVWRLLKEYQLYSYHLQSVQALSPADYPARVRFCQWFLQ
ncbi:hypothetical protein ANN_21107 [Periplaneta americana]|uniref:DUF4817 domain-containing protein n=1 Tax=Periplaneta americana TaxID=6978 RepID=A0ABQ8SEV6_PERAM|nr:hypothetical protein ANN_21107 [Periplaneta americana]